MNNTTIADNTPKENATCSKPTKRVREDKPRKKDEKSLEHVFRTLDSLGSTEHKLGAMCQKYAEMYQDHRLLQAAVKQAEKKNTVLQKEKEQLQSEHSKAILTRSRLENLCRELQRQNKAVKEECMLKIREEGEKKREVATKFHSMLSEIGSLLAQNNNKNAKLRDDNLDMSMRLKSVCDQFEKKEQHVENLAKQMELEMQLADAKLAKAKMEMDIEKETLEKEKQQLVIELAEYKRKLVEMKASELSLREQITMYSEKYEEFHKALIKSNSAIGEFKSEMERMAKHIRRLEKETATWMSRYDAAQKSLAEVSHEKLKSDEALARSQRRLIALQGICRGLQDQCRQLRGEHRRDSQAEEEFKKLEDQFKDVERSAEIDASPCPRKASSEINSEGTGSAINNVTFGSGDASVAKNEENKSLVNEENESHVKSHNVASVTSGFVKSEGGPENSSHKSDQELKTCVNNSNLCETTTNAATRKEEKSENAEPSQVDLVKANTMPSTETAQINLPLGETCAQKSAEDSVNSLVNHVQELSLVDGNINPTPSIGGENSPRSELPTDETELVNCQKSESIVPSLSTVTDNNIKNENSLPIKPDITGVVPDSTNGGIKEDGSAPPESPDSSCTGKDKISSGTEEIIQTPVYNQEESNAKNKKKRKNKK